MGDIVKRSRPDASHHVVCTVAEKNYFNGVAALLNSLVSANFTGTMVVGYRGEPPLWLDSLDWDVVSRTYMVTPGVRLQLVEMPGSWRLNNCKPDLIRRCLFDLHREAELVYFLDSDIVIIRPWVTFVEWARIGVVAVLDMVDPYMSPYHPYRQAWKELAVKRNHECREFTGYVNSGCVGISRAYADFAVVWGDLMEALEREGADMTMIKNPAFKLEFERMDQDVLNVTMMATDVPVALLGIEAMGLFPWTGAVMLHALWRAKPWQRNYIMDALRGFPPDRAHRGYWTFVDGPVRPFTRFQLRRKRLCLKIGRSIGLVHMRSHRDL